MSRALATSMDFLPTFARIAGAKAPDDRIIDGEDISALLSDPSAETPHEAFFYYLVDNLEAVRAGQWKLQVRRRAEEVRELYDLTQDVGETTNLIGQHPDVVRRLEKLAAGMRDDIGDLATGSTGRNCRPAGRVADPKPLTEYDPSHPYIIASYDLPDAG